MEPYLAYKFESIFKLLADKRPVDSRFWIAYLSSMLKHHYLLIYTQSSLFFQNWKRIWDS